MDLLDMINANPDEIRANLRSLHEWREAYYNGTPLVSDAVYDSYEDRIREDIESLDKGDPLRVEVEEFLARVGAPVDTSTESAWEKAKHRSPMGSLNKAQHTGDHSEVSQWFQSCQVSDRDLFVSEKLDGISIALYYEDGELIQAVTRGDGVTGEDITRNVKRMKDVQVQASSFTGDVRGEIILRHSDWKEHFPTYSNPRNAASGIAKRLEGHGSEHLQVLHYRLNIKGKADLDKEQQFKVMRMLGMPTPNALKVTSLKAACDVYQGYIDGGRARLDYDIDGLVIEFNSAESLDSLGEQNGRPHGAIAYKFPHERKPTVLQSIQWQVGNTGRVTPVAHFDTVRLAGADVSKATLHNLSYIGRLTQDEGFCQGDTIEVSRRNDVIPGVEALITSNGGTPLGAPDSCPECGTGLVRDGEYLVCPNDATCPAQVSGLIKTWVSKIGLKGVGPELIDYLCREGLVSSPADLYRLDVGELTSRTMNGRKIGSTANKVVDEIHSKMELPLHVFLGSLNIPLCSRSTFQRVVEDGLDTMDAIRSASVGRLESIDGMGTGRATEMFNGLKRLGPVIDDLLSVGLTVKVASDGPLKGKSVCLTGFRDSDLTEAIEAAGGAVKSGVSKTLSILVAQDPKSNSGKAKKARGYGVEIISPDEMWERLRS